MVAYEEHIEAEFSRIIDVEGLADEELRYDIEASEAERAALARRFGLLSLDSLKASISLSRVSGNAVRVSADFVADVVQACVVTLEPVASRVTESFGVTFAPDVEIGPDIDEDLTDLAEDLPEPLIGGTIDIGETVAQYLALALDPYPRAPGVQFEAANYPGLAAKKPENSPFAALAALRKRGQD